MVHRCACCLLVCAVRGPGCIVLRAAAVMLRCAGAAHVCSSGSEVVKLQRISIGGLELQDLAEGTWRYASQEDIQLAVGIAPGTSSGKGDADEAGGSRVSSGEGTWQQEDADGSDEDVAGSSSAGSNLGLQAAAADDDDEVDVDMDDVEGLYEYYRQQREQQATSRKFRSSSKFRQRREMLRQR